MSSLKIESFTSLQKILSYCDQLMLGHQYSLMSKDFEGAYGLFEEFANLRIAHLTLVEHSWLNLYKNYLDEFPAGGRPEYLLREKKLILRELKKYTKILTDLALHGPDKSFRLVNVFEGYIWFKDLLDHHDAREKAFLFPVLDTKLTIQEKAETLKTAESTYAELINSRL